MYLFIIFIIIFLVLAGLLLVPFHLSFYLNTEGFSICGFFKVKWFGLLLYKRDLPFSEDEEDRMGVENNAVERGFKLNHAGFPKDAILAFFRVLKGLTRSIHVEHILCKITFGLNDPADTALVCGFIWASTSAVSLPGTYIRVYPYFEGRKLAGSLNAEIRGRLLWVFVACINALRETPIRRLLKELLRDEIISGKRPEIKWPLRDARGKGNGNAIEL